ncbi:hypothetical protein F4805DRAFT_242255 [Annulohypoxylon moriforme]|nr:hypothetical protein F4805DRAFT_242255 [Annulohypoxylon moriforme]
MRLGVGSQFRAFSCLLLRVPLPLSFSLAPVKIFSTRHSWIVTIFTRHQDITTSLININLNPSPYWLFNDPCKWRRSHSLDPSGNSKNRELLSVYSWGSRLIAQRLPRARGKLDINTIEQTQRLIGNSRHLVAK